jgi:hypothetical protein
MLKWFLIGVAVLLTIAMLALAALFLLLAGASDDGQFQP